MCADHTCNLFFSHVCVSASRRNNKRLICKSAGVRYFQQARTRVLSTRRARYFRRGLKLTAEDRDEIYSW